MMSSHYRFMKIISIALLYLASLANITGLMASHSALSTTNKDGLQVHSLTALDDAFIRGGTYSAINYGSDSVLEIKQGSVDNFYRKSLLKFDLSHQDFSNVRITHAILRLYANGKECSVAAYKYSDDWDESTVTWDNAPVLGERISTSLISDGTGYYDWDITSYANEQIQENASLSIALYDPLASNVTLKFNSKEAEANFPELIIYTSNSPTPAAPGNLNVSHLSHTLNIRWVDNATNEAGFYLERKQDEASFEVLKFLASNQTMYTDANVTPGSDYTYRVRAFNEHGYSDYSNLFSIAPNPIADYTNYYVDAVNGDDANTGRSEDKAWKSLSKVSATTFLPASRILFKAGDVWVGRLYPKGSGNSTAPIIIDQYGEGNKPVIDGNGMTGTGTVYLYNQEYWEINNLEITNDGDADDDRRGVRIELENYGTAHHIHLKNLYIHHIKGAVGQERYNKRTAGIGFGIEDAKIPTHFDDILVEGCLIHTCQNQGIITEYSKGGGFYPGTEKFENVKFTNAAIRNNTIYEIAKNAMILRLWEGGIVENNLCYNTANGITGNTIFTAACDGTVFQYNEGYENNSPEHDGSLYDADLRSPRTIWQYSYSHDNAHGLFITCTVQEDEDIVCRYNISQNDKGRIFCLNYPEMSTHIYNNTIYVGEGLSPEIISERAKKTGTRYYTFENNLIYNMGSATYDFSSTDYSRLIDNNCFYGNHDSSEPADNNKTTGDPMLMAPGTAGTGLNTVNGYKLQPGSSCINTGKTIENNGAFDYWGNALNDGKTDIGAHEYSSSTAIYVQSASGHPALKIYPNPLTQNMLSIDLSGFDKGCILKLTIMNAQGQVVFQDNVQSGNVIQVDTQVLLKKSFYIVSVTSDGNVSNAKLTIQ
jgi:hypothetical protein